MTKKSTLYECFFTSNELYLNSECDLDQEENNQIGFFIKKPGDGPEV